ncbi:GPRNNB1 [Cordylochernes scorpioides]|uniref:GPRNNB1 n=1 Tax=Cordylochernes scorpioides TaxID=51811 RepID=A0ABY6JXE5_9ARAC|nr:GPRNNB1 [Cordylochernes scorpioides]
MMFGVALLILLHISAVSTCPALCTCSPHDVTCVGSPFPDLPPGSELRQLAVARPTPAMQVLRDDALRGARLASLRLTHGRLIHLHPRALAASERQLSSLDLSFNRLIDLPDLLIFVLLNDWPISLRNLFLGQNRLTILHDNAFSRLVNLTSLDLDGNLLREVHGQPFPSAISTLSISNNLLEHVPWRAIAALPRLTWLNLSGNLIQNTGSPTLKHHFDNLDLSHNLLTTISDRLFNGSLVVRDLRLDYNFLKSLSVRSLHGLFLERVSFSNNRLTTLPDLLFQGHEERLKALDFSFNLFSKFPSFAIKNLSSLAQLFLRGNQLEELDEDDFVGCRRSLEILDLSKNLFKSIPKNALQITKKLARLSLQDNLISTMIGSDFHKWGFSLTTLSLANNLLESLELRTFLYTPMLRELKLSFNHFKEIDSEVLFPIKNTLQVLELSTALSLEYKGNLEFLSNLTQLEWLEVNHNYLLNPCIDHLALPHIVYLNMEGNSFTRVPLELSTWRHVKDIILSHNHIDFVKPLTFSGLHQVTQINLYDNRINEIYSGTFANCSVLHSLILTNNVVETIHHGAFYNLPLLTTIYLQDNLLANLDLSVFEPARPLNPLFINVTSNYLNTVECSSNLTVPIQTLDLSHNGFKVVSRNMFKCIGKYLKKLFLSHNEITYIHTSTFEVTIHLQILHLDHNKLLHLNGGFIGNNLQILSLKKNRLQKFPEEFLLSFKSLKLVDLSDNNITISHENKFLNPKVEEVDVSNNFIIRPNLLNGQLPRIGFLDLSNTDLQLPSGKRYFHFPALHHLNLSWNNLLVFEEEVFADVPELISLDISHNPLWRFNASVLRPLRSVETLQADNTGLENLGPLPLPRLRDLHLANNRLGNLTTEVFAQTNSLRKLILKGNRFAEVPRQLWSLVPRLRTLDLSHNPIEVLSMASFAGLDHLTELDLRGLALKFLDSRVLYGLRFLQTFRTGSYGEVRAFRLHHLLARSPGLRRAEVEVGEATLAHQLQWTFGPRLRELAVTGRALRRVLPDAFLGLAAPELALRLSGTALRRLPDGLLRYLADVRFLTLDLRGNRLTSLEPEVLSAGGPHGTQHIPGTTLMDSLVIKVKTSGFQGGLVVLA